MAEGRRPGGLTALAVLNFVFAGLGLLGLLAVLALFSAVDKGASENGVHVSSGAIYAGLIFGIVRMVLMLAAGVGYLGMKKWGRTAGNLYGILGIADTAIAIAMLHTGFGISAIIGLIYPVLTLILINTTFKDDLVN
jgi:hypothetical protein